MSKIYYNGREVFDSAYKEQDIELLNSVSELDSLYALNGVVNNVKENTIYTANGNFLKSMHEISTGVTSTINSKIIKNTGYADSQRTLAATKGATYTYSVTAPTGYRLSQVTLSGGTNTYFLCRQCLLTNTSGQWQVIGFNHSSSSITFTLAFQLIWVKAGCVGGI